MKNRSYQVVFFLIILNSSSIFANSEELSLELALQEAKTGSFKIEKAQAQLNESQWKRIESYSVHYPTLTLSGSYIPQHKYLLTDVNLGSGEKSIPAIIPTTQYNLIAQFPIFNGLRGTYQSLAGKSNEEASSKELQWTQFLVEREVRLQFYRALASKQLQEVAEVNLKTLKDHLSNVEKFKSAGISTNYDLLRVEVQVSEAQSEAFNAKDNAEISKNRLGELLGRESEVRELKGELPILTVDLVDESKLKNNSTNERTDLQALLSRVEAADYLRKSKQSFWSPQVNLYSQYQSYNNKSDDFSKAADFRNAYQVGINFTWILFEGFGGYAQYHQAIEQKVQAELNLKSLQVHAKQDFEMWRRKFLYFCSVYKSRESDILKTTESVRLAAEAHKVGSRTNTELLDAESELFRAKASLVNSKLGAIEALINLELVTGKSLFK